jgi:hypothetical protein
LCELVSEVQLCCLELCVCQCQGWTCCCAGGTSSSQMTGCATQFATWLDMSWVSFHDSWKTLMSYSISKIISSTYQEALVLQVKKSLMPRIHLAGENA